MGVASAGHRFGRGWAPARWWHQSAWHGQPGTKVGIGLAWPAQRPQTVWCRLSGLGCHRLGSTPTTGRKWAWRGSGRVAKLCGEVYMGIGWISYSFSVQLSAISCQRSAISNQQQTISNQLSAERCQQSATNNQQSAISCQQSATNNQQSAISCQRMSDKNNVKTQKTKNSKKQRKNALQRKTAKNSNSKKNSKNKVDNLENLCSFLLDFWYNNIVKR